MSFKGSIQKVIDKYGEDVSTTVGSNSYKSKACIQSKRAMNKALSEGEFLESGYKSLEQFLYIGLDNLGQNEIPINTVITAESGNYIVKSFSKAYFAGECVYVWANLEKQIV